jgi:hypothetical protein
MISIKHVNEFTDDDQAAYMEGAAPGAYPSGTRIVKCMSEKGDGHKVGDKGTVIASIAVPEHMEAIEADITDPPIGKSKIKPRYIYTVIFDDNKSLPIHIGSYKIVKGDTPD